MKGRGEQAAVLSREQPQFVSMYLINEGLFVLAAISGV